MVFFTALLFLLVKGTETYENLALNKSAWQEHDWPDKPIVWGAAKAVDGRYSDRSYKGGQCTISNSHNYTATWRVDLQSVVSISHINIYYRTDNFPSPGAFYDRFAGFFVYVSNTTRKEDGSLCFHELQQVNGTPTENQTISCPIHGRYVIYYNERGNPDVTYPGYYSPFAYNDLCELEVYGCHNQGVYGEDCNQACPGTCQEQRCNINTGECLGCLPGYQGDRCGQVCNKDRYGLECSLSCGNCSDGDACNHVNGTCLHGCSEGVEGEKCQTECQAGYYGKNCGQRCSENCVIENRCNRFTGECNGGCKPGWKTLRCTQKCDVGMYGVNCSQRCGNCLNGLQCHHVNGTCAKGCAAGYEGATCRRECSNGYFGINCQNNCMAYCGGNKTCDSITGVCDDGCVEGLHGPLCNEVTGIVLSRATCDNCDTSIIISIVISLVVVLTGSIVNLIIWKRNQGQSAMKTQRKLPNDQQKTGVHTEKPTSGDEDTSHYADLGALDKPNTYEELHHYTEAIDKL